MDFTQLENLDCNFSICSRGDNKKSPVKNPNGPETSIAKILQVRDV